MNFFPWPKMASFSGLGIGLVSVLGCIILALVAEFYYLLWLKKNRNNTIREEIEDHHHKYYHTITNYVKQLSHLFYWNKPNSVNTTSNKTDQQIITNNGHEQDLELGSSAAAAKERGINGDGEEEEEEEEEGSAESELMRLHSICGGPPRFLFTIKEETKEDLESDDGRSRKRSRTRSLSDIVVAVETPMEFNPLFESSSPPPKFKFLRDAEEKLMRKLMEEAEKLAIEERDINNGSFIRIVVGNKNNNNKEREAHQQCHSIDSTQVLPLDRNKPIEK